MTERSQSITRITAIVLAIGTLVGCGVVFSGAQGTAAVASDATIEVLAQDVLGSAAVSRSLLSETLLLSPTSQGENLVANREELRSMTVGSLDELTIRIASLTDALDGPNPDIADAGTSMISHARDLLALSGAGTQATTPSEQLAGFRTAYDRLIALAATERDVRAAHIAAIRHGAAATANAARFLVAFMIPAVAIVLYFWVEQRRQQREALRAQLEHEQERRAARDDFLAAVSHELRTPLTAVVGFAEALRDGRRRLNTGERNELIEILADQAQSTAAIVEDLLTLARANVGNLTVHPEELDARAMIDRLVHGWSRSDRTRLVVSGTGTVWADGLRVGQILRCLLANAVEHGRGSIDVTITHGSPITRIEVTDNGPGIPASERDHVFEPYRRSDGDPGQPAHIGLGLTVARTLARLMSGDLVYRHPNTFELSLPQGAPGHSDTPDTVVHLPPGVPGPAEVLGAVRDGTFATVFQPIVDITPTAPRRVIGYEALTRFPFGTPPQWFNAAEESGLRLGLELATIASAVEGFERAPGHCFLTLNVSEETLVSTRLLEVLSGIEPERIILELTEDAAIRSYEATREAMAALADKGYRLAIDDMGTGQTDLWHLVRLHPAVVKLDISLVAGIDSDPHKRALVNGVTRLATGLEARVIAEGIERIEELDVLRRLGVGWGQGYLLGKPGPLTGEPVPAGASTGA